MILRILIPAFCLLTPFATAQAPKVGIQLARFEQYEDGPSLPDPPTYYTAETLFFSCRVSGFKAAEKDEKDMISLEWKIDLADDQGNPLSKPGVDTLETEVTRMDREKDWMPIIRFQTVLPQTSNCSKCTLSIAVRDRIANTEIRQSIPFVIQGKQVEPSDTLTVRNFRFLRTEEDANPLAVAAYRAGDEVWGRFEIVGYKLGEENRVNVSYGLKLLRPSGHLLYEEPTAATMDETSFYPRRFVPGILSLKLGPKLPPGEYPIVLEVKDLIGNQTFEQRYLFSIE